MMRLVSALAMLLLSCTRSAPAASVDDDTGYVRMIQKRLNDRLEIFDGQNRLARKICGQHDQWHEQIAECHDVVARLPPLMKLP